MSDGDIQTMVLERPRHFLVDAPTTATIILDGVKAERWRILVGHDAHRIDQLVRQSSERRTSWTSSRRSPAKWAGGSAHPRRRSLPTPTISRSRRAPGWTRDPAARNATGPDTRSSSD